MEQTNDQWLWFVDNELVEALARTDTLGETAEKRPVRSAALVKALALNMEGKTEQAWREVRDAIEGGETLPELIWIKAHLEFQLGRFEDALQGYEKVLETSPNHKAGVYNLALCLEKLQRFEDAAAAFRKAADLDPKLIEATPRPGRLPVAAEDGRGSTGRLRGVSAHGGGAREGLIR